MTNHATDSVNHTGKYYRFIWRRTNFLRGEKPPTFFFFYTHTVDNIINRFKCVQNNVPKSRWQYTFNNNMVAQGRKSNVSGVWCRMQVSIISRTYYYCYIMVRGWIVFFMRNETEILTTVVGVVLSGWSCVCVCVVHVVLNGNISSHCLAFKLLVSAAKKTV